MDKVEEDTHKEATEGAEAYMKMELKYHISTVTLKVQSGPHYKTIQGKGSPRNRYAQSSCKIKRGASSDLSVL